MKSALAWGLAAFAMSMPVHAGGPSEDGAADAFAYGIVQEQDVGLVFDYLRDALGAAMAGREPSPPPEVLRERAQTIADEMRRRSEIASRALLDAIERSIRDSYPEAPQPPTGSPVQRTRS